MSALVVCHSDKKCGAPKRGPITCHMATSIGMSARNSQQRWDAIAPLSVLANTSGPMRKTSEVKALARDVFQASTIAPNISGIAVCAGKLSSGSPSVTLASKSGPTSLISASKILRLPLKWE